ncbi:MAG: hypothetical protein CMLOHMNK_01841 [Steroidobacteraceae bacterium]|nr:hypothetical protein [Steroidobacteraceae bacterium]
MKRPVIMAIAAVSVAAVIALLIYGFNRHEQRPAPDHRDSLGDALVRSHSPVIGSPTSPVTIVEFLDPACEGCRAIYPHVKQILADHAGEVRLVVRYVPFHGQISIDAVRILEAARDQGKFEDVLTAMFETQPMWANHDTPDPERAWQVAAQAGVDLERARAHVASDVTEKRIAQDIADLRTVGIKSTPTFYVNGKLLPKPDPVMLREMVMAEVARAID